MNSRLVLQQEPAWFESHWDSRFTSKRDIPTVLIEKFQYSLISFGRIGYKLDRQ